MARGRRTARALELVLGVAVGIAVADLIVLALGTGTLVIGLVVALASLAALLLGAGTILVNQAAISAILVATLTPPSDGPVARPLRGRPHRRWRRAARRAGPVPARPAARRWRGRRRPVAEDLSLALADVRRRRWPRATRSARAARWRLPSAVDEDLAAFFDAVAIARETLPVLPGRRPRERLPVYAEAAQQMDYAVRNTRVLARRALATVRRHGAAPPALAEAVAAAGRGRARARPRAGGARAARSQCAGWR